MDTFHWGIRIEIAFAALREADGDHFGVDAGNAEDFRSRVARVAIKIENYASVKRQMEVYGLWMSDVPDTDILTERLISIIEATTRQVARLVNSAMVQACWNIDREIVETEQGGEGRTSYGGTVVKRIAERVYARFEGGFSYPTVKRMKQFYVTYPSGSP